MKKGGNLSSLINPINVIIFFADVILVVSAVYGFIEFFKKKAPLYFKILTLATTCYALISCFRLLYIICFNEDFKGLGISFFGFFGCYLFLFSANYGQFDYLIDDKSPAFRKYRIIALIAPFLLLSGSVIYTVGNLEETSFMTNLLSEIGYIPAILASYYNLKHLIMPDCGIRFIKWIKFACVCALVIESFEMLSDYLFAFDLNLAGAFAKLIVACAFLLMLILAGKGRKIWLV